MRSFVSLSRSITFFLAFLFSFTIPGFAGLTVVSGPGNGKIVFGQVDWQTTEAGAMGAILRALHNQFGDKPQVGKLFDVRGTQSVACFFGVNQRNQGRGQRSGMLIVAKVASDHVEGAVVSDDAATFTKNLNPMLKTLFASCHPFAGTQSSESRNASGPTTPAATLRTITLPDHSASVGLPEGWQVLSPQSGGGTIVAQGPNGENVALGVTYLALDLNNPQMRQTYETVQHGGLRGTMYEHGNYYSYGGDLATAFVALAQMTRQKAGRPPADFRIASASPFQAQPPMRCVHLLGKVDAKDGKGDREMNTIYCTTPPVSGSWLSMAYHTAIPVAVADKERATMGAILQSFQQNMQVINGQAAAIAAPAIAQIHAIGRMAAQQAVAAHERNDIYNSSVYKRWDEQDKRSQEFENYQLGYSVVQDTPNNARGTFWNEDAAALVQHDPQRYEYVNAPDYWKGIDY